MSFKGSEKHVFLGGNTPYGFFSYYDYLIPYESARKIYCIKGGPGTGKSTFMKKIASEVIKKGADVEFAHCSSDPCSLDAVVIKPANIAFVDATSPHVVDPKYPGAIDTILYLGNCWDEKSLANHRDGIVKTGEKISEQFARAYRYLGAAKKLMEDVDVIFEKSLKGNYHAVFEESMIFQEFAEIPVSEIRGRERKLFASAFTPEGNVNYIKNLLDGYKVYVIKGYPGKSLDKIGEMAMNRGFDTEKYYCPMFPDSKIDHLLIPKLNLAFTVSNEYHSFDKGETVDFGEFCSKYILEQYREEREFAKLQTDRLINCALSSIGKAKQYHDELEKYYIPAMDFGKIDAIYEKTVKEVLEFI